MTAVKFQASIKGLLSKRMCNVPYFIGTSSVSLGEVSLRLSEAHLEPSPTSSKIEIFAKIVNN